MAETTQARRVAVARTPRDQIGHWVAPAASKGKPCPHSCCAGKRVHPSQLPVRLNRDYLHSLSDEDLGRELASYVNYADTHGPGLEQITAEVERRGDANAVDRGYSSKVRAEETAARQSSELRENRKARQREAVDEWRDEVYRQWLHAESATNGYMLNKAGKRKGIDERRLFTGNQRLVDRYASDELREYFDAHPRPTRARFDAQRRGERRDYQERRDG